MLSRTLLKRQLRNHHDPVVDRVIDRWWSSVVMCVYEQETVGRRVIDKLRQTHHVRYTVGPASRTMCKFISDSYGQ